MISTCCWCQKPLQLVDTHWWCPTRACKERQFYSALYTRHSKTKQIDGYLYVPTPKQVEFDTCPAKYVLYGGAAGPGKSHAARWSLYRRACRIPKFEALLLRRTFPELEKTHLRRMAQEAESVGATFTESKRMMTWPNGSLIECGHMEDTAAVQKYLSTEYDVIVPDEGATFEPLPLLELATRARTSKPQVLAAGGAKFWIVSNPGGPASSTLLDFFIDHAPDFDQFPALRAVYEPEQWTYIPAQLQDNPYIDPEYERQLTLLPQWRYDQLRHGDWRVFMGQFFSQFNERRHVKDLGVLGEGVRWFRSLDWGFNQPGCWGLWAILPDGRLYKRSDRKFSGESVQDNIVALKRWTEDVIGDSRIAYNVGDPSIYIKTGNVGASMRMVGQSIGETFGLNNISLLRGENDRYSGWQRLQDLLRDAPDGDPWLLLHPSCKYSIRSMASAISDKKDPDDVDTNSDDHALDETRYAAMSRPHPLQVGKTPKRFAPGTMGELRQQSRHTRRLGSESVRPYA